MNVLWDITLSVLIAVSIISSTVFIQDDTNEMIYSAMLYSSAQQRAQIVSQMIESDIRNAGIGMTGLGTRFTVIDTNRIELRTDMDLDGIFEIISWNTGISALKTENPNDILLHRISSISGSEDYTIGLISLGFRYFNRNNIETVFLDSIAIIEFTLILQSRNVAEFGNPGIEIIKKVKPRNLE